MEKIQIGMKLEYFRKKYLCRAKPVFLGGKLKSSLNCLLGSQNMEVVQGWAVWAPRSHCDPLLNWIRKGGSVLDSLEKGSQKVG